MAMSLVSLPASHSFAGTVQQQAPRSREGPVVSLQRANEGRPGHLLSLGRTGEMAGTLLSSNRLWGRWIG